MSMKLSLLRLVAGILLGASACSSLPMTEKSGEKFAQLKSANPKEIVFIHGMFVTPKCWAPWEERFKKAGYRVSAPAWPLHEASVKDQRSPAHLEALGKLEFAAVLDYYRKILKAKTVKPILIGHSMGGLFAQILLSEGLGQAAVAIDSAPPNGLIVINQAFFKSNWGVIDPFASKDRPIELNLEAFSFAFLNQQDPANRQALYDTYYVPESRRVGKGPTLAVAEIDAAHARGPLLILAGKEDHIIPAELSYKNFKLYSAANAFTEFKDFEGRDHWTLAGPGWQTVADEVSRWLAGRFSQ